jgi:hypothetical protein
LRVIAVRGLAALVGAALGLLPVVPPEHVHEVRQEGRVHLVIHRHLQPHGSLQHHAAFDSTTIDDDDPIFTLNTVYTVPARPLVVSAQPVDRRARVELPPPQRFQRRIVDVEQLIHGPPRAPTQPRAPPSSPVP